MKITTRQRPSTVGYIQDFFPHIADASASTDDSSALSRARSSSGVDEARPEVPLSVSGSAASQRIAAEQQMSPQQQGLSSLPRGSGA